ncbi:unnamed protein product, partial [Rotaria socialis]
PPSNNLLYQTSSTNPFQNTRWPMPDANNIPGSTNYPIVPVTEYSRTSNINHQSSDPSASSNGMVDDNSLDTY